MNAAREPNPLTAPISPTTPGRRRRVTRASPPRRTKSDLRTFASPCESPRRRSRSSDGTRAPTRKLQSTEDTAVSMGKVVERLTTSSPNCRNTLLRKSLQGERAGISWTIMFDTPFSHCRKRMNIITGVETFDDQNMELIPGQVQNKDLQFVNQEDSKKPASSEKIQKPNSTSPAKTRSFGGNEVRTREEDACEIAMRVMDSGEKSGVGNNTDKTAPRRISGEKNHPSNANGRAAPRRISRENSNLSNDRSNAAAHRRTSGERSREHEAVLRRTSGERSREHEAALRRTSGARSRENEAAPRRTSGERIRENEAAPRRTSGERSRENEAAPRRTSGEKSRESNSKIDEAASRRDPGEKNIGQYVTLSKKGSHDLTDRYFTRPNSDSERSADDDNSAGDSQPSNAILGNSDDFSIDPLANFLPRAIDDSIHRRTLTSTQLSIAGSQISEESGLEVRPSRRGRRQNSKKLPMTNRVQKGKALNRPKESHLDKGATDASTMDNGASRKSLSSASDTSSYDTNGVAATFMQFTLTEKGFVQTLSKDHDIESESTMQLAKAVAESSVPHLPMYEQDESAVALSENPEVGDGLCDGDENDRNRHARQEIGIKSRFNQIGRKLRDVQRSLSGDGLEVVMKAETKKKRSFLKAAHASFMRSSTSDDGIFGFRDELSSENNSDNAMQDE